MPAFILNSDSVCEKSGEKSLGTYMYWLFDWLFSRTWHLFFNLALKKNISVLLKIIE